MNAQLQPMYDSRGSGACRAATDGYEGDEHAIDADAAGSSTNVRVAMIKCDSVDLAEASLNAIDVISRLIDDRRQALSIALPPAGTVWVRGDHVRLIEVVVNLLTNASKYTKPGGRILLELEADSETATIIVRDSGMGIPKDFLPRIFDLFSQGAGLPEGVERGLGLGLPMVRNVVRLHGGEVCVYSAGEGRGSEFTVRLPRLSTA